MKIDKGIPYPARKAKYPFNEMDVGDSFFIEAGFDAARSSSAVFGSRNNKKFSFRKVDGGFRCWRIL